MSNINKLKIKSHFVKQNGHFPGPILYLNEYKLSITLFEGVTGEGEAVCNLHFMQFLLSYYNHQKPFGPNVLPFKRVLYDIGLYDFVSLIVRVCKMKFKFVNWKIKVYKIELKFVKLN